MDTSTTHPVKRIAILGANGQIGKAVDAHLREAFPQADIVSCMRNSCDTDQAIKDKVLVFNPFTDHWQKLGKVDVLINCIGIIEETPGLTFERAHIGLTKLTLANRQLIGNPKLIQISVLGADSKSHIDFLRTKGKADELLLQQPDTVVIRPSIVCTPNTMMVQKLRMLGAISTCLCNHLLFSSQLLQSKIQPIMGKDVACIIAKVCTTNNHPAIIHAVGPSPIKIAALLKKLNHEQMKILPVPHPLFHILFKLVQFFLPGLVSQAQYQLLFKDNIYDPTESKAVLGRNLLSTDEFWAKELNRP